MRLFNKVGGSFPSKHPEILEITLARVAEQDTWNDVFTNRLIQLVEKVEAVESEIREGLRTAQTSASDGVAAAQRAELAQNAASERALEANRSFDSSENILKKTILYLIFAVAFSWIATVWMACLVLSTAAPVWLACAASLLVVSVTFGLAMKLRT